MDKQTWTRELDKVSGKLAAAIIASGNQEKVAAMVERGVSDWVQNMVQQLKLDGYGKKLSWLEKLTVEDIASVGRFTHEALDELALDGLLQGAISKAHMMDFRKLTIADKKLFLVEHKLL